MIVIRPVAHADLEPLVELAGMAGAGLTTLPKDRDLLRKRIAKSVKSFAVAAAGEIDRPGDESYLFVMEDQTRHRVIGACGIVAKTGGYEPFYAYRIEKKLFESRVINIRREVPILMLVKEHDGPCEVGSLFLHPEYRGGGNGRFLQLVRFLYMAERPEIFEATVVSELRGVLDENGRSPFWDALGRHFFGIDFAEADRLSIVNKKFIAELMPEHPIYIPLLPPDAQAVIGKPHKEGVRAMQNLEQEGFTFSNMVDIFDAGPIMSCPRDQIRTIRQSRKAKVAAVTDQPIESAIYLIGTSGAGGGADFRACKDVIDTTRPEGVRITNQTAATLRVHVGDTIRYVELFATSGK